MVQTGTTAHHGPWAATLRFLAPLTLVLVAGLTAYLGVRSLLPVVPERVGGFVTQPGCDLGRGACAVVFPGYGTLALDLGPRPLAANAPLAATLSVQGTQPDRVVLELAGVDMDMGTWTFPLEPSGDGVFAGSLTLPACVRRRMRWRVDVQATAGGYLYATALDFTVGR